MRDRLAERHRELVSRHEVLRREPKDGGRYEDLLERVFDASDDLLRVVDEAESRSARRRRLLATGLLVVALIVGGLVAGGALTAYALIVVVVLLGAAVGLWLTAHPGRRPAKEPAVVPRQRAATAPQEASTPPEASAPRKAPAPPKAITPRKQPAPEAEEQEQEVVE